MNARECSVGGTEPTAATGAYEAMEWRQVPHEDWCPQKPPVCECDQDSECGCLRSLVLDARSWARHGFEIGQRSCTWSDNGVAPDWLIYEHDYASFAAPSDDRGAS